MHVEALFLSKKELLDFFKLYFGAAVLPKRAFNQGRCAVTTVWMSSTFFKISAMFLSCSAIF